MPASPRKHLINDRNEEDEEGRSRRAYYHCKANSYQRFYTLKRLLLLLPLPHIRSRKKKLSAVIRQVCLTPASSPCEKSLKYHRREKEEEEGYYRMSLHKKKLVHMFCYCHCIVDNIIPKFEAIFIWDILYC